MLDLPGAWQLADGAGVTVAIIDSGARLEHPDLAPNIWTNFDEVPGNGVDDDNNGYVDDVHGVDLSSSRPGQNLYDGWGHGTHVAGIVAAARNSRGVVGVAPRAKLMIVRVLDDKGAGTTGGVAEGIRYAAANGARVINLSLSGPERDPRLVAAVQAANAANVLLVTSAGNDGVDIDSKPAYPAALPAPNLLAVASTDPDSGRGISEFSNYGKLAVQVAAPGAQILSTASDGSYVLKSGTSMAAPIVAGVAALAASVNPSISAADLRALLTQNATRSDAARLLRLRGRAEQRAGGLQRARAGRDHAAEPADRRSHPQGPAHAHPGGGARIHRCHPPLPGPARQACRRHASPPGATRSGSPSAAAAVVCGSTRSTRAGGRSSARRARSRGCARASATSARAAASAHEPAGRADRGHGRARRRRRRSGRRCARVRGDANDHHERSADHQVARRRPRLLLPAPAPARAAVRARRRRDQRRHRRHRSQGHRCRAGGASAGRRRPPRPAVDAAGVERRLPRHQQGQPGAGDHPRPAAGHRRRAHHTLEPDPRVAAR